MGNIAITRCRQPGGGGGGGGSNVTSVTYDTGTEILTVSTDAPATFTTSVPLSHLTDNGNGTFTFDNGVDAPVTFGAGSVVTDTTLIGDGTIGTPLGINLSHNFTWTGLHQFANSYPQGPGTVPTLDQELVDKAYVDIFALGLSVRGSVRVATTGPQNLATDFENGDVIDGVTLATDDRVLIKNQVVQADNGIYVVQVAGAPVRADDYDETSEVQAGSFCAVIEGLVNQQTLWVQVNQNPTINVDPLIFNQLTAISTYTASLGVKKVVSNFEADIDPIGGITLNGNSLQVNYDGTSIGIVAGTLAVLSITGTMVGFTTDDVPEGITNLYFTAERAQDAVGAILTDTDTIDMTYDDAGNTITADVITQLSVTSDGNGVKLVGDSLTLPLQYYGTNGAGAAGYHNLPATGGQVDSVVAGTNVDVDNSDPINPIVNACTQNVQFSGAAYPASLSTPGNVNNYNPPGWATSSIFYLTIGSSGVTITGFAAAGVHGDTKWLHNTSNLNFDISNQDGSSLVANRVWCVGNTPYTVAPNEIVMLQYDLANTLWRLEKQFISFPTGVQSVNDNGNGGVFVDNTDPSNPIISFTGVDVDGVTITGTGVLGDPLIGVDFISSVSNTPTIKLSVGAGALTADVLSSSITYPFIQDVSTNNRILGRSTAGAGVIEELTVGPGLALAGGILSSTGSGGTVTSVAIAGNNGITIVSGSPITTAGTITLGLGAITPTSVAASGTVTGSNLSGTNTGNQTITLTGDVTGSGTGSFAATITNDAVTYAKMQNVTANRLLGRESSGAGDMEEITLGTNLSFTGTTLNAAGSGITPAALSKTDDTNVTLALSGIPNTALLQATNITAGWTGTLAPGRGGTGIANNAASTLTISGAFATTLTVSAATGVTLPTTGTLATLAGAETLSNKTILAVDGTAANCGLSFVNEVGMGLIRASAANMGLCVNGTQVGTVTGTYLQSNTSFAGAMKWALGTAGAPTFTFQGNTTTGMYRVQSNVLGFSANSTLNIVMGATNTGFSGLAAASITAKVHIAAGTTAASTAPLKFNTGPVMTTAEIGAFEYTTPQLFFTNGGIQRQEIPQIQQTRVSTQYDNTTTTLGNVTGLTATVVAGKIYRFEAHLYGASNVAGGIKVAIAGTATATSITYDTLTTNAGTITQSRSTALGTASGAVTAVTVPYVYITGLIVVNAAGTLTVQAAANAAVGTTSILVGSQFVTTEMA